MNTIPTLRAELNVKVLYYMRRYVDAGEEAGGPSKRLRRGQT